MSLGKITKVLLALCCLPGIFLVVSGILLMYFPATAELLFDLEQQHSISHNLLAKSMGIRQVAIGLMIITLAYQGRPKALGLVMLIGALVPLADFFAFYPSIGVLSAMRHGAVVPIIAVLGLCLLKSGDKAEIPFD